MGQPPTKSTSRPETTRPTTMHDEEHLLTPRWNMRFLRHRETGSSPSGLKLQSLVPTCPICGESTKGHLFGQVASTPISENNKPRLIRFFGFVREHEWNQLNEFKEWDSTADNLVAYALKGDHQNGVIIVLKDVFELYGQNEIVLQETLSPTEMAKVSEAAALEWQAM